MTIRTVVSIHPLLMPLELYNNLFGCPTIIPPACVIILFEFEIALEADYEGLLTHVFLFLDLMCGIIGMIGVL